MPISVALVASLLVAGAPESSPDWVARQRWPIVLGGGIDALGFHPGRPHPVFIVGTELRHVARKRFVLAQPIELGYLYHRHFDHGPHLDTLVEARGIAAFGLYAGGGLGLGVQHTMVPGRVYRSDGDGYVAGWDRGRTRLRGVVDVTMGFDFSMQTRIPLRLFARYQQVVLVPFARRNGLPVMGRAQIVFGLALALAGLGGSR